MTDSTLRLSDDVKIHVEDTDEHEFLITMSSANQGALVDAIVSRVWLREVGRWMVSIADDGA